MKILLLSEKVKYFFRVIIILGIFYITLTNAPYSWYLIGVIFLAYYGNNKFKQLIESAINNKKSTDSIILLYFFKNCLMTFFIPSLIVIAIQIVVNIIYKAGIENDILILSNYSPPNYIIELEKIIIYIESVLDNPVIVIISYILCALLIIVFGIIIKGRRVINFSYLSQLTTLIYIFTFIVSFSLITVSAFGSKNFTKKWVLHKQEYRERVIEIINNDVAKFLLLNEIKRNDSLQKEIIEMLNYMQAIGITVVTVEYIESVSGKTYSNTELNSLLHTKIKIEVIDAHFESLIKDRKSLDKIFSENLSVDEIYEELKILHEEKEKVKSKVEIMNKVVRDSILGFAVQESPIAQPLKPIVENFLDNILDVKSEILFKDSRMNLRTFYVTYILSTRSPEINSRTLYLTYLERKLIDFNKLPDYTKEVEIKKLREKAFIREIIYKEDTPKNIISRNAEGEIKIDVETMIKQIVKAIK